MDESIENMLAYLDIQAPGVRCVVVHGIGGSGKTTLAKTLFNQLSTRFEACSFLADIRESSKHELKHLQKKLIRDLLPKDSGTISDTDGGLNILQERLHNKKVLIVLDDVDKREQIERLAGSSSWFSPGSRIIVTTRDTRVLVAEQEHMKEGNGKKSEELWTLEMGEMNFERALQLFSRHAFKMDYPPSDFLNLSKDVISVIGRLPLALEITGSYLCGKPKEAWEDNRNMMVRIPQKNIQKTLMISSEALDFRAKQIFLDIACLPTKTQIKTANYMWESCGFRPEMGTKELILASIIKVRDDGELWMHDYLKDLGKEIICIENFMDSGMRSRLWDHEEALGILKRKEATNLYMENLAILDLSNSDICEEWEGWSQIKEMMRMIREMVVWKEKKQDGVQRESEGYFAVTEEESHRKGSNPRSCRVGAAQKKMKLMEVMGGHACVKMIERQMMGMAVRRWDRVAGRSRLDSRKQASNLHKKQRREPKRKEKEKKKKMVN
ncbi:hypothetical protein CRG98_035225 [Punica granatum]|uniref:Uncharacterized protein n=1 Tax=Punica granatum TaxID=22663 RepID=A0A2I0IK64_PUNGR|nr:hypothetical protein CRG98_035225 [Punica granatum]